MKSQSRRNPDRGRRRKVAVACDDCRSRKIRCDGVQPGMGMGIGVPGMQAVLTRRQCVDHVVKRAATIITSGNVAIPERLRRDGPHRGMTPFRRSGNKPPGTRRVYIHDSDISRASKIESNNWKRPEIQAIASRPARRLVSYLSSFAGPGLTRTTGHGLALVPCENIGWSSRHDHSKWELVAGD